MLLCDGLHSIDIYDNNDFIVTYYNSSIYDNQVIAQKYNSDGTKSGDNFIVNEQVDSTWHSQPTISILNNDNFVIVWYVYQNGHLDILAQNFSKDCIPVGANFWINDDDGLTTQKDPQITSDELGNYVIAWEDYRNGNSDIYAQRFSSEGIMIGNNFRVTNTSQNEQLQIDIKLFNNKIYSTWTDNRIPGRRYDIWANILDWENPTNSVLKSLDKLPSTFQLSQNYPNPFNNHTKINYFIPKKCHVLLELINISGQRIKLLVNEEQSEGHHTYTLNLNSLSSGIYL